MVASFCLHLGVLSAALFLRPGLLQPPLTVRALTPVRDHVVMFPAMQMRAHAARTKTTRYPHPPYAAARRTIFRSAHTTARRRDLQAHSTTPQSKRRFGESLSSRDITGSARHHLTPYELIAGPQVRPAVWIAGPEPQVSRQESAGLEGDVIVEITIDERGKVVDSRVIMSLSPLIDERVIDALRQARFIPANRNGVPQPSEQEVHYHFPA